MDTSSEATGNKMEEELRRRLAFHFMDPVDKFIARRQVPWKLLLQFLKGTHILFINFRFQSFCQLTLRTYSIC